MDATEQLAFESEICCGVLGNGRDFVLIHLGTQGGMDQKAVEEAIAKGFVYCGILGVKDGQAGVQCEPDPGCIHTMMYAALGFARIVADRLREQPKGDGAEWLGRLYQMPDTREN
jgi:hypothetical protein